VFGRYYRWLHGRWPAGRVEPYPVVREDGTTDVPGLRVVGDLRGVPLLKLALDSGARAAAAVAAEIGERRDGAGPIDLAIVGGGVSGMAAAVEARRLGLSFLVLEAREPFATIADFPKGKPIFTYPSDLEPAGELQVTADVKEALLGELQRQAAGIEVRNVRALGVRAGASSLEVDLDGADPIAATRVIVAIGRTGSHRRLGAPGDDLPKVWNRLHDPADFRGKKTMVVGCGDGAVETALLLAAAGAETMLVHRGPDLSRPKEENAARLLEAESTGKIAIHLNTSVRAVRPDDVVLVDASGERSVANHEVFAMLGRVAPLDFFRRSGVRIAGEWTRSRAAACAAFVLLIAAVLDWKSGGILADALRAARFFPFSLASSLPEARSTLAGVVARSAQYPGFWYTLAYSTVVVVWGVRRVRRRKTPYVRLQTAVLAAIQVGPLFLLPEIVLPWLDRNGLLPVWAMDALFPAVSWGNGREYWRAYGFILAWPLSVYNVFTDRPLGAWLWISIAQTFVLIPLLVWRFGKGAYCGWICSCGALAETLGDAQREKMPHGARWNRLNMLGQALLAIAFAMLVLRVVGWQLPGSAPDRFFRTWAMPSWKWGVDVFLGGVLGLGLYFWMSGRTWCRFACPLAALMHVYARFSRFAIHSEKAKCISCGICTQVCHQGIDVQAFAQRGLPMQDPQCVRCSACVSSCPTGTLSFGSVDARAGIVSVDRLIASAARAREARS